MSKFFRLRRFSIERDVSKAKLSEMCQRQNYISGIICWWVHELILVTDKLIWYRQLGDKNHTEMHAKARQHRNAKTQLVANAGIYECSSEILVGFLDTLPCSSPHLDIPPSGGRWENFFLLARRTDPHAIENERFRSRIGQYFPIFHSRINAFE